jgi:hypothetical protein
MAEDLREISPAFPQKIGMKCRRGAIVIPMTSQLQIQANRKNSQKSTGPRSRAGKAVSRFNALKSGLHAQSQVIPGEDAAELEALAASYREQFQPESPQDSVLVDSLIAADWQLRRLRKIEAQLWQRELTDANAAADMAEAYSRNPMLDQVQRRIQTTERHFRQNLKLLQQMQKEDMDARVEAAKVETGVSLLEGALARLAREKAARQSGSFSSGQKAAADAPAPRGELPK